MYESKYRLLIAAFFIQDGNMLGNVQEVILGNKVVYHIKFFTQEYLIESNVCAFLFL